ncbi:MAG: hypothetical protein HY901_05320 [Deltaproteobacteria bacterium]|nr:hypothetical protein [Deltaproteobacteria bacterium]
MHPLKSARYRPRAMPDKPNYFREAVGLPAHKVLLLVGVVASLAGLWRGHGWPLLAFLVAEAFYLFILPTLPAFRAWVGRNKAGEAAHQKAINLDRIASRLSPNAKARLDGVTRVRGKVLDSMHAMSAPDSMLRDWTVKLDELVNAALRILVAVDGTRVDDRDQRFLQSEIKDLEAEVAKANEGPAKAAKQQRLDLLKKRAGGTGLLKEQREAAVTQLETLEDLLKDLQDQALAGRDAAAFGQRMASLQVQIQAAGETVAMLDRQSETSSELAVLKAGK